MELFAGKGELTKQVAKVVETLPSQDFFTTNGVDFRNLDAVKQLWAHWQSLVDQGARLIFHVAPPCSTFSRARDRSQRTRLRSLAVPSGWYPQDERTQEGNAIARHTAMTVNFLVGQLNASGTWEQPAGSYMFPYLEQENLLTVDADRVVLLHQCRFGRPWKKPTTFTCFGGMRLRALDKRCTPATPCVRKFHVTLGFGSAATAPAAEYPSALCAAYAADVAAFISRSQHNTNALSRATVHVDGVVTRHQDRGRTELSAKALREAEDAVSWAGANRKTNLSKRVGLAHRQHKQHVYMGLLLGVQVLGTASMSSPIGQSTKR